MNKPVILAASALSALIVAGGVGVGIASADPTTPAPSPSASATSKTSTPAPDRAKNKAKKHRGLATRALHGEVTLGDKKPHVVDFQRGTVSAVSDTSVTVKSKDGFSATYVVSTSTKVHKQKKAAAIADVTTGDRVRVVAAKDGTTLTARRIGDAGAK